MSVALSGAVMLSISQITVLSETTNESVYIGGEPFGVKFYSDGVIIVELESYYNGEKYVCPAKEGGMKVNDIITEANGNVIRTNEELAEVTSNSSGKTITLTIKRNGREIEKKITPEKNTVGVYLLGTWVRDSCAGIGTVTYYDDTNNYFAALGHGICDYDTSVLLPLGYGEISGANISGITKSTVGKAGSLDGYFTDKNFGVMTKNTDIGIYGTMNDNFYKNKEMLEIADKNEIKCGKAKLFTTIEGEIPQYYNIEITKICNTSKKSNENFVIKITDYELINKCGGIVQGMSGSPIIQNEKIVGAVTHVFLNNPTEGYGVMTQNMVTNFAE